MKVSSSGGGDFKPVPEGTYIAVCVRVIDLGTQVTSWQGADKVQRKVLIAWEVPEIEVEYEGETMPALIMNRYTASLHEKSQLYKHLVAWRGRAFTPEELRGFDLKNVLGKACQIQVIHTEKNDRVYANIAAIMGMPKGMKAPEPKHDLIDFSLDVEEFSPSLFDTLSDGLKTVIEQSPEYKLATGKMRPSDVRGSGGGGGLTEDLDDEIPF